jgi:hypothetical protein
MTRRFDERQKQTGKQTNLVKNGQLTLVFLVGKTSIDGGK